MIASLIASAKLDNVEPYAYLRDILERMASGHPANELDKPLPWNWSPVAVS